MLNVNFMTFLTKNGIAIVTALVALCTGFQVQAQNVIPVRVCSLPLPPQTMPDADGNPSGYAVEILQALAVQLQWDIEISYSTWARVVQLSKGGQCDVVLTVLKRDDYESYMVFPERPILNQRNVLATLKNRAIRYDGNLENFMRSHMVGLYNDKAIDDHFESLRRAPWARVDVVNTPTQNIMKLLAGRIDAAIDNDLTIIHELKLLGRLDDVEILEPAVNVTPAYITFPMAGGLSDAAEQFDQALETFEATPEFRRIQDFYLRGTH